MASFHIDAKALVQFPQGEEASVIDSWESLVWDMLIRFGTTAYDDPMEALIRLRRSSTVLAYKGEFESLSNRIKDLSPQHKLKCFLSELKDEIKLSVRMLNPSSLNVAFGLAKIQEE